MSGLIGRKLAEAALVGLIVSFATFLLVNWTGDLAISLGGMQASKEELVKLRAAYGLRSEEHTSELQSH